MMYQTIVPMMPTPTKKIKMVIKLEMCVTIVQKMQIQDSKILMEMVSGTNVRMTLIMMELLMQMTTAQKYLMLDKQDSDGDGLGDKCEDDIDNDG